MGFLVVVQFQDCAARPVHSVQHGDYDETPVIASCNPATTGPAPRDEDQETTEEGRRESKEQTEESSALPVILGNVVFVQQNGLSACKCSIQ